MENAKGRILAIDDNPANLHLLGKILKGDGYEVRMAPNGALALSSARREPPDLILLDIRMPDISGYQICEKLKADKKLRDIPVIFISALFDPLEKVKAFSLGGVDYITKPFSADEALARVRIHLEIRSLQIRLEKKNAELRSMNEKLKEEIEQRKRAEKEIVKYQNKLRRLYAEMTVIEERERSGMATELHDNIGQQLALLKMKLGAMKRIAYENEAGELYDEICGLTNQALKTTRTLMLEISPTMLYDIGFEPAIGWLVEQFQMKHGIEIKFERDEQGMLLRERSMFQLFRTTRELLQNVVEHSDAENVKVKVSRRNEHVRIVVEDDGVGFDFSRFKENSAENKNFGLFGIQERMADLGGELEIDTAPGKGTKVVLQAPLDM